MINRLLRRDTVSLPVLKSCNASQQCRAATQQLQIQTFTKLLGEEKFAALFSLDVVQLNITATFYKQKTKKNLQTYGEK